MADERGSLTELFRDEWFDSEGPVQWNFLHSRPNTLRGVHCHVHHFDFLTVVEGELILGLKDLRTGSISSTPPELHRIKPRRDVIVLPPGVAHGFYFEEPTSMMYGVSRYWSTSDELGCRWDDPDLGIDWPCSDPLLSTRDQQAGPLLKLINDVQSEIAEVYSGE